MPKSLLETSRQPTYVWRNTEARSRNHRCCGKSNRY